MALIATGPFGTKRSFVPISAAGREDDAVTVPFDKARVDPDRTPSESEEQELSLLEGARAGVGTAAARDSTTGHLGVRVCVSAQSARARLDAGADG